MFLARQNQRVIITPSSMQGAEIFARRERRAAAITVPESRRFTIRLSIDGDSVESTYAAFDRNLPGWASPVLHSLAERWGARPGWDSYGAQPTNPDLVVKLLNILFDLMQQHYLPPQVTPLTDGGVQAEWHCRGRDLELVVTAGEQPTYYYGDPSAGVEEEAEINPNYAHVQALMGQFS